MLRRLLSAAGAAAILLTLGVGGAVLPAAAEENEYVLLIDDFEDEETIAHYSSYAAQPGSLYQSKTHAHSGENSAMFVSQGAYGCVVNQPDFNNQIRLTADGEVLEADHSNAFDAIRIHILNPGREVVFRMQFTSSLGTAFFLDKTIPASEDFVAYDFPLEDFHKSAPDSGEYFSGVTDPAHADVWETLFVYVDAETELKLFLDDLSYVKYDYTPPATTTTETPTTTTTDAEDTTAPSTKKPTTAGKTTAADASEAAGNSSEAGFPVWGIVLIAVGAAVVLGGVITAVVLINKKKQNNPPEA